MADETTPDQGLPANAAADRPAKVGPYHVLDVLGEGGMGTVYLAEQRQPVRRRVALKVIKLGMDTKSVLARFDAERQALSMMDHTNIARVYECGATDTGQPWFAMEHVKGIPITDYCDRNRLSLSERIGLFKKVCAAVQHAHLKGVMHRDLKPSNVLVMLQDDTAIPKVIDFGLAKAVDHKLVEATLFTEQGVVLRTPEYMSPEQAGLGGLDIDTRTDVYSLGVLLYELLTGDLPFRRHDLRSRGLLEMQRVIRETDPPKPSTRVTTMGAAAEQAASLRGLDATELGKSLRGDLDWILMRALEKDPTRRYQSIAELSADLGRYLKFEPVLASPPELGYRLRKFVRRFRLQVAAAALVVAALVTGAIATLVQYRRAEAALVTANQRAEEADRARVAALASEANAVAKEREATERARDAQREKGRAEQQSKLAEAQSAIAREKEQLASEREREAREGQQRLEELNRQLRPWRLSVIGPQQLSAAVVRLDKLDQQQPVALQDWLEQDAARVLTMLEEVRSTVTSLRQRAQPVTREESQADRELAARGRGSEQEQATGLLRRARDEFWLVEADDQFLLDTMSDLQLQLERFARDQVSAVQRRLVRLDADRRWRQAKEAIAKADDIVASHLYGPRGAAAPIELQEQRDLVPIGMNPVTKLWEFYHLPSAGNGGSDAAAAALPKFSADGTGRLSVGEATGIVFVLIPSGSFVMGAQTLDSRRNYDRDAQPEEMPTTPVLLQPFFLARYELTQAQWARLAPDAGAASQPSMAGVGQTIRGRRITPWNPVENVDWSTATGVLQRHGLSLPTEAQWEYACRARTTTPWSCTYEQLASHANVADATADDEPAWLRESWRDDHKVHAPVGSFLPNAFGLHDMHGNVWEWCSDEFCYYEVPVRPGDGQRRRGDGPTERVRRGGGFGGPARLARSASRAAARPDEASAFVGLRAARALDPN